VGGKEEGREGRGGRVRLGRMLIIHTGNRESSSMAGWIPARKTLLILFSTNIMPLRETYRGWDRVREGREGGREGGQACK